jgi:hypothetical protein
VGRQVAPAGHGVLVAEIADRDKAARGGLAREALDRDETFDLRQARTQLCRFLQISFVFLRFDIEFETP